MVILAYAAAFIAALAPLAGCATDLAGIDKSTITAMTLDLGDGRGALPYPGGTLPESADPGLKTYRFAINFSARAADFPDWPVLVIGPSAYPFRIYLNGRLLSRYGSDGDRNRIRRYASSLVHLSREDLLAANVIEVVAQIGTERTPLIELGLTDSSAGSDYVFWRNFFISQLVAAGFVLGLLLFAYFMFMFMLGKGKEKHLLWFALLCGFFAMAYANMVFNQQAASDTVLTKLGRTGFFFCVISLSFYVMETTGILARKRWLKLAELAVVSAGSLWVLIQKDFSSTNDAFLAAMQVIITPNLVFSAVLLIIAVVRKGFREYAVLCVGMAGLIASSLYDMYFESRNIIPYAYGIIYGFEWLVICVFMELAIKQERVSRKAIKQANDLVRKNTILKSVFQQLRDGSDTLQAATEDLAVSTREISFTGNQQAAAVREIVSTMEDSGSLLNRISGQTSSVRADSEVTAQRADDGAANVKAALDKLEDVIGRISASIDTIAAFNEQLGTITGIVKLIEGIATHIRIIAFNASLEAVAAGEAGRNFGIVAEEVKRLADSTVASVKNIREKVGTLLETSDEVVKVSRQGYVALEQSWDIASGIGGTFSGIAEAADSAARATADIDVSIGEENMGFSQIIQTLKEVSAGVNNFVDSAVNTSETTKKINAIAEQLHGLIEQYSGEFMGEGGQA
jgi:methyl-accepting chemotaxis protein